VDYRRWTVDSHIWGLSPLQAFARRSQLTTLPHLASKLVFRTRNMLTSKCAVYYRRDLSLSFQEWSYGDFIQPTYFLLPHLIWTCFGWRCAEGKLKTQRWVMRIQWNEKGNFTPVPSATALSNTANVSCRQAVCVMPRAWPKWVKRYCRPTLPFFRWMYWCPWSQTILDISCSERTEWDNTLFKAYV